MVPEPVSLREAVIQLQRANSMPDLAGCLSALTASLGYTYFALAHHLHPSRWHKLAIGLHNCPDSWVTYYAEHKLYRHDPILLACAKTTAGFTWDELPNLIELTPDHEAVLNLFREAGVGRGVTIPAHIPGEPSGSCTFATSLNQSFDDNAIVAAQLVGAFAFQAARRIAGLANPPKTVRRSLTPRQRDCLLWAMRGKTDWEIGQILSVSPDTVRQHLDLARNRYGVTKRMQLAVRAIYLGDISFEEALA
jgi:LuxR family transcriptional regulator, quorum-sensing system regulator CciR